MSDQGSASRGETSAERGKLFPAVGKTCAVCTGGISLAEARDAIGVGAGLRLYHVHQECIGNGDALSKLAAIADIAQSATILESAPADDEPVMMIPGIGTAGEVYPEEPVVLMRSGMIYTLDPEARSQHWRAVGPPLPRTRAARERDAELFGQLEPITEL
jgi:hypothetical protein